MSNQSQSLIRFYCSNRSGTTQQMSSISVLETRHIQSLSWTQTSIFIFFRLGVQIPSKFLLRFKRPVETHSFLQLARYSALKIQTAVTKTRCFLFKHQNWQCLKAAEPITPPWTLHMSQKYSKRSSVLSPFNCLYFRSTLISFCLGSPYSNY